MSANRAAGAQLSSPDESDHEAKDRKLFDQIAEKYCYKDLHPASRVARRRRLSRTLSAAPLPDMPSLLEVGCGAGFSARYLDGTYSRYLGIDYSEQLVDYARKHNPLLNAWFEVGNAKSYQPDEKFDCVFMIGVLHHLDDMDAAMGHMLGLLKPGGWLVANEPQPANPLIRCARSARKRLDNTYSPDQAQLSGGELRSVYSRAGLTEIRVIPQGLLSTPLAEIPLSPVAITWLAAHAACAADAVVEALLRGLLGPLTWNLIAAGRKPGTTDEEAH